MEIDLKQLKELMRFLKQFEITELELERNGERIKLCRTLEGVVSQVPMSVPPPPLTGSLPPPPPVPNLAAAAVADNDPNITFITSPFVGTFYEASSPGSAPFV